jgi:hypothetical protein
MLFANRRALMKKLAFVTHDPVNESFVRLRVEDRGAIFSPLTLRDPVPAGQFDRILIDWDSLDPKGREALLAGLLTCPEPGKVGLSSYNLNDDDAAVLRGKGVAVFERVEPDAIAWLHDGVRDCHGGDRTSPTAQPPRPDWAVRV